MIIYKVTHVSKPLYYRLLTIFSKVVIGFVFVTFIFLSLLFNCYDCYAGTWTQTTDSDFNSGTLTDVKVTGTGTVARVRLKYKPNPVWTAKSAWNAPDVGWRSSPAFADLDNDGDFDLLIGEFLGGSYAYENTGSATSPVWTAKSAWNAPDVGDWASPAFADLDDDGDFDLLIGERWGLSYAYENTGSITSPIWTAKSAWNAPDVGDNAVPAFADLDDDGDFDLLIGEGSGICYAYENTGSITSPIWTAKSAWNVPDVNLYVSPAFADLDDDGDYDFLIGDAYGSVYAYENTVDYFSSGNFISLVFNCQTSVSWGNISWTESIPAETGITFQTRTGDTPTPDGSWSNWSSSYTVASGTSIASPSARYIQEKANFSTSISTRTPILSDFTITYNLQPSLPVNSSPLDNVCISNVNPKFVWSEFNDIDGDSQVSFQIQLRISTGTYGDGNYKDSGEIASNLASRQSDWDLIKNTSYFWRVRVKDNSGFSNEWSNWSTETSFWSYNTELLPNEDNVFILPDGTKVEIPAGAVEAVTTIEITEPVQTDIPEMAYDSNLKDSLITKEIKLSDPTISLKKEITITLTYTDNDISGLEENNLKVAYYDEIQNFWKIINNSIVYPDENKIVAKVDHLTLFKIVEYKALTTEISGLSNYPNPFVAGSGNKTRIRYSLKENSDVEINIYDLIGELVWQRKLSSGESGAIVGPNEVEWDGINENGDYVSAGAYICIVKVKDKTEKTMLGVK